MPSSPRTDDRGDGGLRRLGSWAAQGSLLLPFLFVLLFFFVPMGWLVATSLSSHEVGSPPRFTGTLEHYTRFWTDPFYLETALWTTVKLSVLSTALALIIGYVLAYYIASLPSSRRGAITAMIVVSLAVNIVIRIFGLNVLLMNGGLVTNVVNGARGLIGMPPMRIMSTELGVLIGLVQIAVPYVVLPLIGVIAAIDPALKEAAASVGANRRRTFWSITFPLSIPGIVAGTLIAFTLNAAAFAIPSLMGGGRVRMMGMMAYEQATIQGNFPFAAAVGISLTILSVALTAIYLAVVGRLFRSSR